MANLVIVDDLELGSERREAFLREQDAPADDAQWLEALRRFHLGLPEKDQVLPRMKPGTLPALLSEYRDVKRIRNNYPLIMTSLDGESSCMSLTDALADYSSAGGRILADNLERLERVIYDALRGRSRTENARAVFERSGRTLRDELALTGEHAQSLEASLEGLVDSVPADAVMVPFSTDVALRLISLAAANRLDSRLQSFQARAARVLTSTETLLKVELGKTADARSATALGSALAGPRSDSLDPQKLAELLGPHRGSRGGDEKRIARIEEARRAVANYLSEIANSPRFVIVHSGSKKLEFERGRVIQSDSPCETSVETFHELAAEHCRVFAALRTLELEQDQNYIPERHGPWLDQLDWSSLSVDEFLLIPPVVALQGIGDLQEEDLLSLSRVLRAAIPIKAVVHQSPCTNSLSADKPLQPQTRFEVGYFGISHREALVHQSSPTRPEHMLAGFERALGAVVPSLHILESLELSDGKSNALGPWLHSSAAIESRGHPVFCYDPSPGESWAARFEISDNPAKFEAWSSGSFALRYPDGRSEAKEAAFTFADFALLEPAYEGEFRHVPEALATGALSDDLVTVPEYLELDSSQAGRHIPFVWGIGPDGEASRFAMTRTLALLCRDRARFWRTLQELAGVRNAHVERAVAVALERAQGEHTDKIAELEQAHAEELAQARQFEAKEAMQRLAAALLDTDLSPRSQPASTVPRAAPVSTPEPPATEAQAQDSAEPAVETEADDSIAFDDPWIDSPLCTSCNDCIQINQLVFVYDENKQAKIGDASKGTFEQIVRAAEVCPAKCIHPGKPLNPSEENLDELIKRAEPFN
jgi:ferredoxin